MLEKLLQAAAITALLSVLAGGGSPNIAQRLFPIDPQIDPISTENPILNKIIAVTLARQGQD